MRGRFSFTFTRPHYDDWLLGMEFIPQLTIRLEDAETLSGSMFSIGLLIFRIDYLTTN